MYNNQMLHVYFMQQKQARKKILFSHHVFGIMSPFHKHFVEHLAFWHLHIFSKKTDKARLLKSAHLCYAADSPSKVVTGLHRLTRLLCVRVTASNMIYNHKHI